MLTPLLVGEAAASSQRLLEVARSLFQYLFILGTEAEQ